MMWILVVYPLLPEGLHYTEVIPEQLNNNIGAATGLAGIAAAAPTMPTEGSALTRIVWLGLLAFGLGVVALRYNQALKVLKRTNRFLLLFMALSLISAVWSIAPEVTIRRFIRLLTFASDGLAFALLAKSATNFQTILRSILTTLLIGSVIFVIVAPNLAIEQSQSAELVGAWHGLAPQKNALGSMATISLLLWLHACLSKESPLWRALPGLVLSAICLLKSRSSSSLMAAILASGLLLMLLRSPHSIKRYMPYLITVFVCIVLTYSLAVLNFLPGSAMLLSPITALTGKDLTFSGRSDIWQIIEQNVALHPLLGGGYGAYWTGLLNSPSMVMLQRLYYYPTESHNGYLDVMNDLGYVGVMCLGGYLFTYLSQGLKLLITFRSQGALYLTLLFDQLIGNLSEARWFNSLSLDFLVMSIATIAMAGALLGSSPTPGNRLRAVPRAMPHRYKPPKRHVHQ